MSRTYSATFTLVLAIAAVVWPGGAQAQIGVRGWPGYGGNPQHTAISPVTGQAAKRIRWSAAIDLNPQYNGNDLYAHYGSPMVTINNTVITTVKTGATDGFKIEARRGYDGTLLWTANTDYSLPAHNWTPSCGATLVGNNKVAFPGAGGTIYVRDNIDSSVGNLTQYCFYGLVPYQNNKAAMDAAVQICTPLTADTNGNIFFGYVASGNPLSIESGIARIGGLGSLTWLKAATASGNSQATRPLYNCAPAISNDGTKVYMAFTGNANVLAGMSTANLTNINTVVPLDPKTNNMANFADDGTSSATIGPDGDVYFGAFENPFGYTHYRGYLYHFTGDLVAKNYCGAFGWDDTCSIIPKSMVPSYVGSSSYLIMTKYNNYLEGSGDGYNKIAILDPNDFQFDLIDQTNTMKEVLTKLGPTPDPRGGYTEWCINTAAVDVANKTVVVNSEDGKCYTWDLVSNTLKDTLTLTAGLGEAYTPTLIGPDGTSYAINNATVFAMGDNRLLPTGLTVTRSASYQGGLFDVSYADARNLTIQASPQLTLTDPALQYVLTSTSFSTLTNPSASLSFTVKQLGIVGDFIQTIEFYNYTTAAYETLSSLPSSNALASTTVSVGSNAKRFVNQTTKEVKVRVSCRSTKLPAVRPLECRFNIGNWVANP